MTPNDNGVFLKPIAVVIPTSRDYRLLIYVARDDNGYYGNYGCDWTTGGMGGLPGNKGARYDSKIDALLAMLDCLNRAQGLERLQSRLSDARHELFNSIHKQLTLF